MCVYKREDELRIGRKDQYLFVVASRTLGIRATAGMEGRLSPALASATGLAWTVCTYSYVRSGLYNVYVRIIVFGLLLCVY